MGTAFFAWYSLLHMQGKESSLEDLKVSIEGWQPTGTEADDEFFQTTALELRSLKERSLRLREGRPEEEVQRSLRYLEGRLRILEKGDVVYTARSSDRLLGFILARWDEAEQRTRFEQFYVDPADRSLGTGTKILTKALQYARGRHTEISQGAFLSTGKDNEGAQRLYERMGFHRSHLPGDISDEFRYDFDFETEQKTV